MQLASLLGNDTFKAAATGLLKAQRLPHAILLAAPDGCGRGFAARLLAADYLYPAGGPGAEAVLRGQSAEVLTIEGEGKSGQIPVARIREARQEIYHSSLSAGGRVVYIKNAQNMAAPAANALLKVLEEPPPNVVFILTARDASTLPLTIVSRCTLYVLAPVSTEACEAFLAPHLPAGANPALPGLLASLYQGRIGLGLAALQSPARLEILQHALEAARGLTGGVYTLLCVFARYEGRADGDREARDYLLADFSAALEAGLLGISVQGVPAFSPSFTTGALGFIQDTRLALRGNAAPKITFTALAVKVQSLQLATARQAS